MKSTEEGEFRVKFWQRRRRPLKWFQWAGLAAVPLMIWKFAPGVWALWNMPFMPLHGKIIAMLCVVWLFHYPLLFYVIARDIDAQMLAKERQAAEKLREMALKNSRESTPAAA